MAYYRLGNQSVPATPAKLKELVLKGSVSSYDSLKSKYKFDNMAFTKLKSIYKIRIGLQFEDSDYESFGIIDEEKNLTNAGALLADESPIRHSRLFCTRWNGLDKAPGIVDAIDDKEYSGGLINLLQEGAEFVINNSKKAWKKITDGRIEMPDYPERAVLEGLVNALIHRNYLEVGSEVHIDMFDDRIEIYSPGGMYDGTKVQERDLMQVPSRRRNPVIADIFNRLKYMDRRGSGFKKIIGDYKMQPQYRECMEPKFNSDNDSFLLVLKNLNYENLEEIKSGDKKRR
jgi:ATP-dependent DNA helicase RecG